MNAPNFQIRQTNDQNNNISQFQNRNFSSEMSHETRNNNPIPMNPNNGELKFVT